MPKQQHLDDKLYVNMVLLSLVLGFSCFVALFDAFYRKYYLSCFFSSCMCTSRFTNFLLGEPA